MSRLPEHQSLIADKLIPRFRVTLDLDRSSDIEAVRKNGCLSPVGTSMFMDALCGYLAGCREEADEVVTKSETFLALAHSIGEQQKYSYAPGFSEGIRSAALSYVKWLKSGTVDRDLIADARSCLDSYIDRPGTLDREDAEIMTPILMYTNAYSTINKLAEILAIDADPMRRARMRGLFGHALRIAAAREGPTRQAEEESLRRKLGKRLFTWINAGHYDKVAYSLFALYSAPEDRPSRLIEECWRYVRE